MSSQLVQRFEKDLKYRVDLKMTSNTTEEKFLLRTFKFFDLQNSNNASFKIFQQVTTKLGMVSFSENEILMMFENYAQGASSLDYRELITKIYGSNVMLSVRQEPKTYYGSKSFTNSKTDTIDQWGLVRQLINVIIYQLRKQPLFSFLNFFRDLKSFDKLGKGVINSQSFSLACKRCDIDMSEEDLSMVFDFFRLDANCMSISKFVDCLCANFADLRVQATRKMFGRFDFGNEGKVNLGVMKEVFNAKNFFEVRTGRKTQDEVEYEFGEFISIYVKMNIGNLSLRSEEFLTFCKLLSGNIKEHSDFINFSERCFRFNELPRKGSKMILRDSIQNPGTMGNDDFSVLSAANIGELEHELRVELARRGTKAMITFYHNLRSNDYDGDGKVFVKEFENSLHESRINLSDRTFKKLFKAHSKQGALDYEMFMNVIVFSFEPARVGVLKDLYNKMFTSERGDAVLVSQMVSHFFARGHPDFQRGRPDFEISNEFADCLRSFLMTFQGSQSTLKLAGFVRFFEFYAFLLTEDQFYYLVEQGFKFKYFNRDKAKQTYISKQGSRLPDNNLPSVAPDRSSFNTIFGNKKLGVKPMQDQLRNNLPTDSVYARSSRRGKSYQQYQQQQGQGQAQVEAPSNLVGASQNSPHDESVLDRREEDPEDIKRFNAQLQKANFQKVQNTASQTNIAVVPSLLEKIRKNARLTGNFTILLELEYEMTRKSGAQGNIDFDVFSSVLESVGLLTGFNDKQTNDLFMGCLERGTLHVQRFINDVRGQISENRENWSVDKFDQIRNPQTDSIHIEDMRKVFKAKQYKWRKQSVEDLSDNYQYMIDLFNCLNLSIKKTQEIDLDDFLYLFDNFSFMFLSDPDFKTMLDLCF